MDNKSYHQKYFILFTIAGITMIFLITLLFYEYRFFCDQVKDIVVLKQQYHLYVYQLKKKLGIDDNDQVARKLADSDENKETLLIGNDLEGQFINLVEENSDSYEYTTNNNDTFIVINRQPEYLKNSALEYLESQNIDSSKLSIDSNDWNGYNKQIIIASMEQKKDISGSINIVKQQVKKFPHIIRQTKDFGFVWPIDKEKFWISSFFGPRKKGFHYGIDMAATQGTRVKSVRNGVVTEARFDVGYGNTVVVKHDGNIKTRYAHLHSISVYVGQHVKQGSCIGTVGETGYIRKKGKDGSHLHFEVLERGVRINPLFCLPKLT